VPYGYKTQMNNGVRKMIQNDTEILVIKKILNICLDKYVKKIGMEKSNIKSNIKSRTIHRHKLKSNTNSLAPKDCKDIAIIVNKKYKNRGDKPFTWQSIRMILDKWKHLL
jgi:hypothetical protein